MNNCVLQILGLTAVLILMFFIIRGKHRLFIDSSLNRSNRKKRCKNQTLIEWFFYRRFQDVLPKRSLLWYYGHLVLYPILVIIVLLLDYIQVQNEIGNTIIWVYFFFSAIPTFIFVSNVAV